MRSSCLFLGRLLGIVRGKGDGESVEVGAVLGDLMLNGGDVLAIARRRLGGTAKRLGERTAILEPAQTSQGRSRKVDVLGLRLGFERVELHGIATQAAREREVRVGHGDEKVQLVEAVGWQLVDLGARDKDHAVSLRVLHGHRKRRCRRIGQDRRKRRRVVVPAQAIRPCRSSAVFDRRGDRVDGALGEDLHLAGRLGRALEDNLDGAADVRARAVVEAHDKDHWRKHLRVGVVGSRQRVGPVAVQSVKQANEQTTGNDSRNSQPRTAVRHLLTPFCSEKIHRRRGQSARRRQATSAVLGASPRRAGLGRTGPARPSSAATSAGRTSWAELNPAGSRRPRCGTVLGRHRFGSVRPRWAGPLVLCFSHEIGDGNTHSEAEADAGNGQ